MRSFYHAAIAGLVIGLVLFIAPFIFHALLFALIIGFIARRILRYRSRKFGSKAVHSFNRININRGFFNSDGSALNSQWRSSQTPNGDKVYEMPVK